MRYSITSKNMTVTQLETEIKKAGVRNITVTKLLGQVFGELDEGQAETLARIPGIKIKALKEFQTDQVMAEKAPVETISDVFYLLR